MAHFFSSKILRWPKIRREMVFETEIVRILGHLRILELKKVGHLGFLTRDRYFEEKIRETEWFEFWAISDSHAYAFT